MRNWLLNRRIPNGMYGGVRGRETNLVSHLLDRVLAHINILRLKIKYDCMPLAGTLRDDPSG